MPSWSDYETFALRIAGPDGRGVLHPVTANMLVGRNPAADIEINDPKLSNMHLRVFTEGDVVWVEDLDSSNGTYLNCVRLRRPTRMSVGDSLIMGRCVIQLLKVPRGLVEPATSTPPSVRPDPNEDAGNNDDESPQRPVRPAELPAGFASPVVSGASVSLEGLRAAPVTVTTTLPARVAFVGDDGAPSGSVVLRHEGSSLVAEVEAGAALIDGVVDNGRLWLDDDAAITLGTVTCRVKPADDVSAYAVSVSGDQGFVAVMPLNAPLMHVQ